MQADRPTPTELKDGVGISIAMASMILSGDRKPSPALAINIYRKFGLKCGPIERMSDEDIAQYERLQGLAT